MLLADTKAALAKAEAAVATAEAADDTAQQLDAPEDNLRRGCCGRPGGRSWTS